MQYKSQIYTFRKSAKEDKHLCKNEEKQILQERRRVLQKHVKNGLA